MRIEIVGLSLEADRINLIAGVLQASLMRVDPQKAVLNSLQFEKGMLQVRGIPEPIAVGNRVFLIGAGKASLPMAQGVMQAMGERVSAGAIITKTIPPGSDFSLPGNIPILLGDHPIPGENSIRSTQKLIETCSGLFPDDLVIFVLSGGASALFTLPADGVSLQDIQDMTRKLLACGARIHEINTLRKHLDRVKGGGLAHICSPARILTLVISDVIGDPPGVIASGPTVPDESTFLDAAGIIEKYRLQSSLPATVLARIQEGIVGRIPETPKPEAALFHSHFYRIIATNQNAVDASLSAAKDLGFDTENLGSEVEGEARDVGRIFASKLASGAAKRRPHDGPVLMAGGGETTVTRTGNGHGGRNLETALAAVVPLSGIEDVCFVSLATDGEDGPTDAAGAIVTGETFRKGIQLGLQPAQYLAENDSYRYFERVGGLIKTGSTGTNVMDMFFLFRF